MQSQTGYSYYITVWLLPISILIFTFSEIFIILEIINYIKRNKKNNIDNAETALIENI
jgi:amino acid permease